MIQYTDEDGKQLYKFDAIINCEVRPATLEVDNTDSPSEPVIEEIDADNTTETVSAIPPTAPFQETDITQRWRLISSVKAWPHSGFQYPQLVDYSYGEGMVLKGAVDLINNNHVDLLWDHSNSSKDVAGCVKNAYWEQSKDIPPGVNADLVVDPDYDLKAAIGLKKGFIRSGSIGVTMSCRPSHEAIKFEKFVQSQGEIIDGEEVRWLPEKLHEVRHMALLPHGNGADKNAGRRLMPNNTIDEGKTMSEEITTENVEVIEEVIEEVIVENTEEKTLEEVIAAYEGLSKKLGIEVILNEDGSIPEGVNEKLEKRIGKLFNTTKEYNTLVSKINDIFEFAGCDAEGDERYVQLKGKFKFSQQGEKLVELYRKDATKWFDAAKAALGKTELSESEKRIRTRITKSEDFDYLEDMIEEYQGITEANLNSTRTSIGTELPVEKNIVDNLINRDIAASAARMFSK